MTDGQNKTLLQTFEWHTPSSPSHYNHLKSLLPGLVKLGITSIWLPPGCKANNPNGNGYDIYDLWDLGEFEQKGARRAKWGDRAELDALIRTARECGVDVVWDAVLNHKQSGDRTEGDIWAVEVEKEGMAIAHVSLMSESFAKQPRLTAPRVRQTIRDLPTQTNRSLATIRFPRPLRE